MLPEKWRIAERTMNKYEMERNVKQMYGSEQ